MMRRTVISFYQMLVCVIFLFSASGAAQAASLPVQGPLFLPDLTLPDLAGHAVRLKHLQGRLLVVNLFANWCPACHREAPGFVRIHRQIGSAVRFVGIAVDDRESAGDFISRAHIHYSVLLAGRHPGTVLSALGDKAGMLPYTLIVAPNGRIVGRHLGYYPAKELLRDIRKILSDESLQ
jgi:peroxiredoxin